MKAEEIVGRCSPAEVHALAIAAVELLLAQDRSLPDLDHRAHVNGILAGAAPTFFRTLEKTINLARRARVRSEPLRFHG